MIGQISNIVATEPREIPETSTKFRAPRILVVDDERLVRWAIAETLGEQGYEILEAGDGESAKREVLMRPPDLVLLDLRLPDSNDLRIASFIRARAPKTPIVLMTAYGTQDLMAQAADLGLTFVGKPFDMNALTTIVERALISNP